MKTYINVTGFDGKEREIHRPIFAIPAWIILIALLTLAIPGSLLSWLLTGESYIVKRNYRNYSFNPPGWTILVGMALTAALIIFL